MFEFLKKKETKIEEYNIICPKCMKRMDKIMKGDIILDVCSTCGGTWFDKNEIEKVFAFMKNNESVKKENPNIEIKK